MSLQNKIPIFAKKKEPFETVLVILNNDPLIHDELFAGDVVELAKMLNVDLSESYDVIVEAMSLIDVAKYCEVPHDVISKRQLLNNILQALLEEKYGYELFYNYEVRKVIAHELFQKFIGVGVDKNSIDLLHGIFRCDFEETRAPTWYMYQTDIAKLYGKPIDYPISEMVFGIVDVDRDVDVYAELPETVKTLFKYARTHESINNDGDPFELPPEYKKMKEDGVAAAKTLIDFLMRAKVDGETQTRVTVELLDELDGSKIIKTCYEALGLYSDKIKATFEAGVPIGDILA